MARTIIFLSVLLSLLLMFLVFPAVATHASPAQRMQPASPASRCEGIACNNTDPYTTRCNINARSIDPEPIVDVNQNPVGTISIMYSPNCNTYWADATSTVSCQCTPDISVSLTDSGDDNLLEASALPGSGGDGKSHAYSGQISSLELQGPFVNASHLIATGTIQTNPSGNYYNTDVGNSYYTFSV